MRGLSVIAFAALTIASSASAATAVCGPWIPQTNGTKWRICTDGQGFRYCELNSGSNISRMVCP